VTLLGVLNTCLIAATVLLGAHSLIDVLATVALFGVSLGLYRWLVPVAQPVATAETLCSVAA
jgi:membrane-associated phospholipid phosphatase